MSNKKNLPKKDKVGKINLPKKDKEGKSYISYSQYSKWKTNKKDYIKAYFLGERFEGNDYTDMGSLVGEALEKNDFSAFEPNEVEVLKKVTRLDQFEREINWDLGEFTVLGFIDTNDLVGRGKVKKVKTIIDYKTGALDKVSVYESDDYDQVTIYAGAIEQETGKLPEKGWVELIERTGNPFRGEPLKVGTEVVVIPQDVSKEAVEKTKDSLMKVAKDITEFYRVFNVLNAIKV